MITCALSGENGIESINMSIRSDEDDYPKLEQRPWTVGDAFMARGNAERRVILQKLQQEQTARANELMKLAHATIHPSQPTWIKKSFSAVSMR